MKLWEKTFPQSLVTYFDPVVKLHVQTFKPGILRYMRELMKFFCGFSSSFFSENGVECNTLREWTKEKYCKVKRKCI